MKVLEPEYYKAFQCLTADCDFTCCRDWTIAVDEDTAEQWKEMEIPEALNKKLGTKQSLLDATTIQDDMRVIQLCKNGQCPYLREDGLCHLVLNYGEEMLSDTCHTFPRERHEFRDRIEYALSIGCKPVLELLWESDIFYMVSYENEEETVDADTPSTESILFEIRDFLAELMSDPSCEVTTSLKMLFYIILDLKEIVDHQGIMSEEIKEYMEDPFVDELIDEIRDAMEPAIDTFREDNELLLDMMENYRKKGIYAAFLEPIAKRAEFYEKNKNCAGVKEKLIAFFPIWMQFEEEMRILLCEEIYASCLLPGGDLNSMVMKMEWIGMEYAMIRQWMFLQWEQTGELTLENLKECIAVVFRMTGYNEEDIEEFLTNSFESPIWDWGYMGLIL